MRAGIVVKVTRADRHRLEAIVSDRSAPQKHVWRANIILATADGCGTAEIMRRSGKSKPVVWRWQARFMAEGVEGLTRDKTRKPGKPPLPTGTVQRVVDLALGPPPGETTHWTGRMLAKAAGVSLRSVQRILEAHQLAPHRIRTFKLSNDPEFAEKLKDIVGLYVDPPAHAVVLSVDEKSQIQALDRTQPGADEAGPRRHDDPRLQTSRHHHAVRRPQHPRRHRHRAGAARLHRQPWLGTVERLNLALFVDREDDRMGGRIDIEADDVFEFLGDFGSFDSLNVRMRCGASWWASRIRCTERRLTPAAFASIRLFQ